MGDTMSREEIIRVHTEMWEAGCELSYIFNSLFDESIEWARTNKQVFQLYWKTGDHEEISGDTIADAFSLAGYSGGALSALDFYDDNPVKNYDWNTNTKTWVHKED